MSPFKLMEGSFEIGFEKRLRIPADRINLVKVGNHFRRISGISRNLRKYQ